MVAARADRLLKNLSAADRMRLSGAVATLVAAQEPDGPPAVQAALDSMGKSPCVASAAAEFKREQDAPVEDGSSRVAVAAASCCRQTWRGEYGARRQVHRLRSATVFQLRVGHAPEALGL